MRIEYSLTIDDVVTILRHGCRTSPTVRSLRRKNFIAGAAMTLAAVFFVAFRAPLPWLLSLLAGGFVFYALLTFAFPKLTEWWGVRALRRGTSLLGVIGAHTMTLEEQQLIDTSEVNENRYRWKGIERIERTPEYLLFWLNSSMAHSVPLRAFASPHEAEAFEAAARRLREAGTATESPTAGAA